MVYFCHHTQPMEEAFSKVKMVLKCMECTLHSGIVDSQTCIAAAIASITLKIHKPLSDLI